MRRALLLATVALAASRPLAHADEPRFTAGPLLSVRLLFDGAPLQTKATPEFSCRADDRQEWFSCGIRPATAVGAYTMPRPAPGRYTLHLEIDENPDDPARYPGDYDVFHSFKVNGNSPLELVIDVPRLLHVTAPWDNAHPLDGMLTAPADAKPSFDTPRYALPPRAVVAFSWEPVVAGAQYEYIVAEARDAPHEHGPELFHGITSATVVTLRLPPSSPAHYFEVGLTARDKGRPVGMLFTHDAGSQGWTFAFTVRDRSIPWWAYLALLGALCLLVVAIRLLPRRWLLRLALAAIVGLAVFVAWWLLRSAAERRSRDQAAAAERATATAEAIRGRAFAIAWEKAVAKPEWFDGLAITASGSIGSLGDLLSIWQSGTNTDLQRRRFFQLAYQAVLDHPTDKHLVATAISLMRFVTDTPTERRAILQFWVDHFFDFKQRTDNCANCQPGDEAADVVRDLAQDLTADGDPDTAIHLISRLRARAREISPWSWALTMEALSRAHWARGDHDQAVRDIEEGLKSFPEGWQADQLRKTLATYRGTAASGH